MTEPHNAISQIRGWIARAESDFKNAEHTLTMRPEECPFDTVCFHCQQMTEKYLKALLVHKGIDFPKTHDVGEIVSLFPAEMIPPLDQREQDFSTQHAVTSRYPGDPDIVTTEEAGQAINIARRVRVWARTHLPPESIGAKKAV